MRYLFFIILFFITGTSIRAQEISVSVKVKEIFSMLPLECKNQIISSSSNNNFECQIRDKDVNLKILYNTTGQISHIGLNLFSFNENLVFNPEVLFFIERSLLDFFLINDISFIKKKTKEDKIQLWLNNNKIGDPGFTVFADILPVVQGQYDFAIQYDGSNYTAIFKQLLNEFKIKFPANNNVITGLDKKEYGQLISQSLKAYKYSKDLQIIYPDTNSLNRYKDSIMVNVGDSYFKSITSRKYYQVNKDGNVQYLFSNQYVLESFANIFLAPFESNRDIILKIKHKIYGDEKSNYDIALSDFLLFFESDFDFYFGIEDKNDESLAGTLIMHNKELNFINLLSVVTNKKELFSDTPTINGVFYTNIPSDNIKNLFSEYENETEINN